MSSTDNMPTLSASSKTAHTSRATLNQTYQTKKETPLIKLTKVEENVGTDKPIATEESKASSLATISSDTVKSSRTAQPMLTEPDCEGGKQKVSEVFKQRMVQFRRQISKGMVFSDQLEMRDPQMVAEHAKEIYKNMRLEETALKVDADYLTKV